MDYKSIIEKRRSIYALGQTLPISENEVEALVEHAVKHVPSAFNSQSARVLLLLNDQHHKFWSLTLEALRKIVPEDQFSKTEEKIMSFDAGAGTVLYFEEQSIVKNLQERFPLYAHNFPVWSEQSSGMLQYVVWTRLSEVGIGASLQHYNEVVEEAVRQTFEVPESWKLIAQMPFGSIEADADEKQFEPLDKRFKVLK